MNAPHASWLWRVALLVCVAHTSAAVSPSISPSEPKVGQKITLTYKINDPISFGGGEPQAPAVINAGGITFTRRDVKESRLGGYNYFRATYIGVAGGPGVFRVPSKKFRAGGKSVTSQSRTFRVRGAAAPEIEEKPRPDFARAERQVATPRPGPASANVARANPSPAQLPRRPTAATQAKSSPSPVARNTNAVTPAVATGHRAGQGSVVLPAGSVFVGQAVPVLVKYPLPANDQYDSLTRPLLAGDGFTASAFEELPANNFVMKGASYNLVTLTSSIVPYRPGAIEIPDLVLTGRRLVAGSFKPAGPGQFPAPSGGGWEEFRISADGAKLDVVELPDEGRPPHFTGAIGSFGILPLEASPTEAGEGQPVVLKVTLKGPGNLASVSAPRLLGADQWRVRATKENFDSAKNTKTFEFTMFARSEQKESPSASLVYFDPAEKKYRTLEWPAVPLFAAGPGEGSGFEAVSQKIDSGARSRSAPPQAAFPWPDFSGIPWHVLRQIAVGVLSLFVFTLLFFWAARVFLRRRREANELLKASLSDAWEKFDRAGEDPADFYAAAGEIISARVALWRGKSDAFDDVGLQLNRMVPDVPLREELSSILARRDELNYGAVAPGFLRAEERNAVGAALERFCEDVS